MIAGLVALAVTYSAVPPAFYRLWPLILVAVGVFGLVRRPGWVEELDIQVGPQISRTIDRPRRIFSWLLVVAGFVFLLFTLGLLDARIIGPALLLALGLVLVWRRAR